jgi:pyruvate/2-oxoglutarate/acetoin dehydrogenase E1 component
VLREGRDAAVIAAGRMAMLAEKAAAGFAGASIRVVSLGAVKPLDVDTILACARETGRVLILQEEPPFGGYGPAIQSVLDRLPMNALKRQPMLLARRDTFLPYNREEDVLPSAEKIAAGLRELLG